MALITFLVDSKEGHLIPSFHLADSLKQRGHDILYLSVLDNQQMVIEQGFRFEAIFKDLYPLGFNQANKIDQDKELYNRERKDHHLQRIVQGELDIVFTSHQPDLVVISSFLSFEALLLHYKYGIMPLLLTTYLRASGSTFSKDCMDIILDLPANTAQEMIGWIEMQGIRFSSLEELLQPLNTFHEFILCPAELDMNAPIRNDKVHYIGPSIFQKRNAGDLPLLQHVTAGTRVIYASLGSYAVSYGAACDLFFNCMTAVMAQQELSSYHLILAVGEEFDTGSLQQVPPNVTIVKWASQIEVLRLAALMITHGGLGSVKESVFFGVPMIVIPIRYDQQRNARLVEFHKLGIQLNVDTLSIAQLHTSILYVLNNPTIKRNMEIMQEVFRAKDQAGEGANIVERLLLQHSQEKV